MKHNPPVIKTRVVGQMATNCYLIMDTESGDTVVVDPGDDAEHISDVLTGLGATPTIIIATHGHFDHIMGAYALCLMYNIPFVIHKEDTFLLKAMQASAKHFLGLPHVDPPPEIAQYLKDKDVIPVGVQKIKVIHTPGHTPGSICLSIDNALFVGDTIFADGAVGRTDFSYSEPLKLTRSIKKILSYSGKTRLLPGHGTETTVQNELRFHLG